MNGIERKNRVNREIERKRGEQEDLRFGVCASCGYLEMELRRLINEML